MKGIYDAIEFEYAACRNTGCFFFKLTLVVKE